MTRCAAVLSGMLGIALALLPGSALALIQTDNERTPTWDNFSIRTNNATNERGAYLGMAMFCDFPEQYRPHKPNPRWEQERPWRSHFVERVNPNFSHCHVRVFVVLPQTGTDFDLEATLEMAFETALPPALQPSAGGTRTITMTQKILTSRRFALPELSGSPRQKVTFRLQINGKILGQIESEIDPGFTLRINEIRRHERSDQPIRRQWDPQ